VSAPPVAAETVFVYVGAALAAWAVLLAMIGLSRAAFPSKGGERGVFAISALLVAASIGTAIGTAKQGPHPGEKSAAASQKPTTASQKLSLSADPGGQLRFSTKTLQAHHGPVELVLSNPSQLQHNISVQGTGINLHGPTVGRGQTSTVTATLKPGTYTFYCSVPGHREAGMQGTLTVK
jgi:uncharacterized cupredoxin-like copper-binding protein